jgi:hypothetical protein
VVLILLHGKKLTTPKKLEFKKGGRKMFGEFIKGERLEKGLA